MTKRRLEREADALSAEVLGDLSADDRLQAVLRQQALDDASKTERLEATAPREDHSMRDPEYVTRRIATMLFVRDAVYDLHRLLLQYRWYRVSQALFQLSEPETGAADDPQLEPGVVLWRLFETVNLYTEFAEEEFGVELATLLGTHENGIAVLNAVNATLDEKRELLEASLPEYARRRAPSNDNAEGDAE